MHTLIDIVEGTVLLLLITVDSYSSLVIAVIALAFAFFLLFKEQNRLFCYLAIFGALFSLIGGVREVGLVTNVTTINLGRKILPTGTTTFFDVASLTFFDIGLMIFILAVFLIFRSAKIA